MTIATHEEFQKRYNAARTWKDADDIIKEMSSELRKQFHEGLRNLSPFGTLTLRDVFFLNILNAESQATKTHEV